MDRRQKKTREAIFKAFSELLETNRFENITVQEIIDKANVGRSTFYAHFETKDHLLKAMCSDIFDHIFESDLSNCTPHNNTLESRLAHILWHLHEHKNDVCGILSSESGERFMKYIKECLSVLFKMHIKEFKADVPENFLLNHLVGSFAEVIIWWVKSNMEISSDEVAKYFMSVIETH